MELQVSLDDARSVISRPDRIYNEMRVGWVLTHLLARSVFSSIADPTVLLREINELSRASKPRDKRIHAEFPA